MILRLACLSLLRRPARHALLLLILAAACALPVFLIQMAAGLYNGLNRAVEPFPILAGAKGSPYQLVINTVFLRDHPIGNIAYGEVENSGRAGKPIWLFLLPSAITTGDSASPGRKRDLLLRTE